VRSTACPLIGIPAATYQDATYVTLPTYRVNGLYTAALAASGAAPVVIPLGLPEAALRAIFDRLDGLLLAGGVDVDPAEYGEERHPRLGQVDRARDATELTVTRWALAADLPIFGICRGIQTLNVAAGGSLYQDISAQSPGSIKHNYQVAESPWEQPTHRVRVSPGSRLAGLAGAAEAHVNSYHHQSVKQPAGELAPAAWAGDGIIEALEGPAHRFVLGVQWHPEGMFASDPLAQRLFAAFVDAARGDR
jgi:putative glutamine amidotransferase